MSFFSQYGGLFKDDMNERKRYQTDFRLQLAWNLVTNVSNRCNVFENLESCFGVGQCYLQKTQIQGNSTKRL